MILLLFGILLLVISIPTEEKQSYREDTGTDLEKRLTNVLEKMEGVGKVQVMVTYQKDDNVEGVVVVAEGGNNAVVIRNVTEVVQALFHVDSHKIKVIKGNQIK